MKAFIVDRYGNKDGARIGRMPDPDLRQNDVLVQIHAAGVNLLNSKIRNGDQLRGIGRLIDSGIIRPVVDRVSPFDSTNEAMAYVEGGRAKGKVVVSVR